MTTDQEFVNVEETPVREASVSALLNELVGDVSQLMRQEIELAKAEVKAEAVKAGKGAGLLGGAGFAGLMAVVFVSLTLMFLIGLATPLWVAALIVTVVWAVGALAMFTLGRKQLKQVNPTPTQTVETLKETF